jgi:hypothetical protein
MNKVVFPAVLLAGLVACSKAAVDSTPSGPSAEDVAACPQDLAKKSIVSDSLWGRAGVHDVSPVAEGIVIVVYPPLWRSMSLEDQKRFLTVFDCAGAGPGKSFVNLFVRQDRDGPDMMHVTGGELVAWRKDGYAKVLPEPAALAAPVANDDSRIANDPVTILSNSDTGTDSSKSSNFTP